MDETTLLLLRALAYLINAAVFAATLIKFPHHRRVLGVWVFWCLLGVLAVLFRVTGNLTAYFVLVDYAVTITLYITAIVGAWVLLKNEPKKK